MLRPTAASSSRRGRRSPFGATGSRAARIIAALAVAGVALTGCAPSGGPTPTGSTSSDGSGSHSASGSSSSTTPQPAPTFIAGGSAEQNLPVFTATVGHVWGTPDRVHGRAYIDALVGAGFDKSAMQVTNDTSTVGNAAESIEFSVRMGEQCLVGQVGPAIGDPVTSVLPVLGGGVCLLGNTRPITW